MMLRECQVEDAAAAVMAVVVVLRLLLLQLQLRVYGFVEFAGARTEEEVGGGFVSLLAEF